MMNSYQASALQEETSYLARVAVILKRMVPISNFSDELALVCAGMSFERANDFVSLQAIQNQADTNRQETCHVIEIIT